MVSDRFIAFGLAFGLLCFSITGLLPKASDAHGQLKGSQPVRFFRVNGDARNSFVISLKVSGNEMSGEYLSVRSSQVQKLHGTMDPNGKFSISVLKRNGNKDSEFVGSISSNSAMRGIFKRLNAPRNPELIQLVEVIKPLDGDWIHDSPKSTFELQLNQSASVISGYHTSIANNGKRIDEVTPEGEGGLHNPASIVGSVTGLSSHVKFVSGYSDGANGTALILWTGSKILWQIEESHGLHFLPRKAVLVRVNVHKK